MTKDIGKVGTLTELGLKEGDVVECLYSYSFTRSKRLWIEGKMYTAPNDGTLECDGTNPQRSSVSKFRIISRASQEPKTWGQMTDEEKGALLLAKHEGKVIEWLDTKGASDNWMECPNICLWDGEFDGIGFAYRVKPEPVVETVVMYASDKMKGFGLCRGPNSVHKLTFKKIDGEIDYKTAKMVKL